MTDKYKNQKNTIVCRTAAFLLILICTFRTAVFAEERYVPGGQSIGVSLSFCGAYVDSFGNIGSYSPAENAGVRCGDIIISANGEKITSVEDFSKFLEKCDDETAVTLTLRGSDGEERETEVVPARDDADGKLKIGAWLTDAASGVGTVTYYDPQSGTITAIGHSISGVAPTGNGSLGNVYRAEIAGVRKGSPGTPGELIGIYSDNKQEIGEIVSANDHGITASVKNTENLLFSNEAIPTGAADEIAYGEAEIMSNISGSNISSYKIEITEINLEDADEKNIIFKVTDEELLLKTGGIVRGMSGSPIIQNGKLVGAVTHVMVNSPDIGYGTFIENMENRASNG